MRKLAKFPPKRNVKYYIGWEIMHVEFADGLQELFTYCVMVNNVQKGHCEIILSEGIKNDNVMRSDLPSEKYIEELQSYFNS